MKEIQTLAERIIGAKSAQEKIDILDEHPLVSAFLKSDHPLRGNFENLSIEKQVVIKQLIAIGQAPLHDEVVSDALIEELADRLLAVENFYREIGGIAGYQLQVLNLLNNKETSRTNATYHSPHFIDISQDSKKVQKAIEEGIRAMPFLCEMYPLGGAADRLHLIDETTQNELPAAKLEFAGRTLLEGLIRDLEAREHLYFQRTNRVITTPIALMTSHEKNNWVHIQDILEKNNYFNRPKESIRLFIQPLVPTVNQHGQWIFTAPWKLMLKPGGHGVIWKLAKDNGIFQWLRQNGSKFAIMRQINNPLAGLDYGLLAFSGLGAMGNKAFGFASCPRLCHSAEGVNVLIEKKNSNGYSYVISNIEYTDFQKRGIADQPLDLSEPYSRFSSNTNILYADLEAIESAVSRCPFPGLIINLKSRSSTEQIGRLESAMQNIADVFVENKRQRLNTKSRELKKTFITYNHRHKTISTTKKALIDGRNLNETPENCFYDLMRAHRDLLELVCCFELPRERTIEETLASRPSFVFLFHPALGPLFREIGKKMRGQQIKDGSELILDLADVDIENLILDGSLQIRASQPLGPKRFSSQLPRCILKNVQIINRGVDWEHSRPFWKANFSRFESVEIILEGRSEFVAENVQIEKSQCFIVRDNERMTVSQRGISRQQLVCNK